MKESNFRNRIELILLLVVAISGIVIAILDTAGLLDGIPWLSKRIPTLILLCVGFIASYLIIERRGKLVEIESLIEQKSDQILGSIGFQVEEFRTSGEWAEAMTYRISRAKRIDDVSWAESNKVQFRWSFADREAHRRNDEAVAKAIRNPKTTWREIYIFFPNEPQRFVEEKGNLKDEKAIGYSVAYFVAPLPEAAPRIGGFMIVDYGDPSEEVFLASSDSTIWLRVKHPAIVKYFANYFEDLWSNATKLKVGPSLDDSLFKQLEAQFTKTANLAPDNPKPVIAKP